MVLVEKLKLGFGGKNTIFVFDGKTLFLVVEQKLDFAILGGKLLILMLNKLEERIISYFNFSNFFFKI